MNDKYIYPASANAQDVHQPGERLSPSTDMMEYFQRYTRERPEVVALWCLGIGFVLGWKLKPW